MKRLAACLCLWILCVFPVVTVGIEEEEGVLVLNSDNFDKAVEENKLLLVEFYAPWCGHCKKLAPEFARAAQTLAAEGVAARLGKVDSTQERRLADRFGVRGYPTLRLWRAGRDSEYTGGRKAEEIAAWLRHRVGPAVRTLATVQEAAAFLETPQVAAIGFFSDPASPAAAAFLEWAVDEETMPAAVASAEAVRSEYGADDGSVVMFKKYDERRHTLAAPGDVEALRSWAAQFAPPLLLEFASDTADAVFDSQLPGALLLFLHRGSDRFEALKEAARSVAVDYRDQLLFAWLDVDDESMGRVMEFFGVRPEQAPAVRIVRPSDMGKFRPAGGEVDGDGMRQFVAAFLAGKLKPHLLSDERPDDWDAQPVKVLVGTSFDQVVLDRSRDVLVDFYAPWCGHCKKLEPELDKLGEKYKDSKTVLIAKMDATTNELQHTKPRSFPTIKMWKKDTNEVIEYNGERTVGGMSKFIETAGEYGRAPPEDEYDYYDDEEYGEEDYVGHDEL
ncbi:protein disulfide-isomerase 2-like [Pollicipes pollicipes]|uniref:protein disulfide-isomerase 2-like n=1 Tax=Pollicipes pollicipes TaxID=41117 RepID=UPI001884A597|nr:protein disulfide-isomerase 2-like [Pollicipes pollicipes]